MQDSTGLLDVSCRSRLRHGRRPTPLKRIIIRSRLKIGNILEECSHVAISPFAKQEQPKLQRPFSRLAQGEASDAAFGATPVAVDFRRRFPLVYSRSIRGDLKTAVSACSAGQQERTVHLHEGRSGRQHHAASTTTRRLLPRVHSLYLAWRQKRVLICMRQQSGGERPANREQRDTGRAGRPKEGVLGS